MAQRLAYTSVIYSLASSSGTLYNRSYFTYLTFPQKRGQLPQGTLGVCLLLVNVIKSDIGCLWGLLLVESRDIIY